MDFYMCQTPKGPMLAGTQADAKALDKGFKQHEVPTAKAPLMAYVNDLLARTGTPAETPIPSMDELLASMSDEDRAAFRSRLLGGMETVVKKVSQKATETVMDRIWTKTEVEHAIWNMGLDDVNAIQSIINERAEELAAQATKAAPVTPRARVRKPA